MMHESMTLVQVGIGVSFQKIIYFFSGPHVGCASDTTIGRRTITPLPRLAHEWWIGDRVYMYVDRVLAGFRRQRILGSHPAQYWPLSYVQKRCNTIVGHYRSRVEQVISVVKNHAALGKGGLQFRGDLVLLDSIITMTMHASAALIRLTPSRQSRPFPSPALDPVGWAH